jgi:glutathione S-transferase
MRLDSAQDGTVVAKCLYPLVAALSDPRLSRLGLVIVFSVCDGGTQAQTTHMPLIIYATYYLFSFFHLFFSSPRRGSLRVSACSASPRLLRPREPAESNQSVPPVEMNSACLINSTCHVWTAGNPTATPWSGLVPLGFFTCMLVNIYMMSQVGAARKKYKISYPTMYAVPGTLREYGPKGETSADASSTAAGELISSEEAFAFNCVQRGHQNTLENLPLVMLLALVSWSFPIPAGFSLISFSIGRVFYFNGYSKGPSSRINVPAALLTYPALITLIVLSIITAAFFFNKTQPYNYS